jgi:hypothetical protein
MGLSRANGIRSPKELLLIAMVPVLSLAAGVIYLISYNHGRAEDRAEETRRNAAPVPEVVLATPPVPATALTLAAYPANDLATDGSTWPRACSLLTDDEVRLVLPQATGLTRTGHGDTATFETKDYLPQAGVSSTRQTQRITVPENSCRIQFDLPHKTRTGDPPQIASLEVHVNAFGDPAVVDAFASAYYTQRTDAEEAFARAHTAWHCAGLEQTLLRCTKGPVTVSVGAWVDALDAGTQRVRMPGQPEHTDGTATRFAAAVQPVVMGHLLDRIPT